MLSAEATQAQVVTNNTVVSNKQAAKKAEKTALNSSIIRNNAMTDTAKIDFLLITCFVITNFSVTAQQVSAFAESVNLTSPRIAKSSQITKHCKDNKLCTVDNALLTIDDDRLKDFYINAFYSQAHMQQLQKHAVDLFATVVDYVASTELVDNCHVQAITMNAAHAALAKKASKKTAKKKVVKK